MYGVVYNGDKVEAVIDADVLNEIGTYTSSETITPALSGYTVKVFAWDITDNIKPICKALNLITVSAE